MTGIIVIQVSWIRNMVLLRKEQIKHNVQESAKVVGNELAVQKGSYAAGPNKKNFLTDEFILEMYKPPTIGRKIDIEDIKKRLDKEFGKRNLKNIHYEFGVATYNPYGDDVFEKMTPNFITAFLDTTQNWSTNYGLQALSGTAAEGISVDEVLYVTVLDIDSLVFKTLKWRIVTSLFFTFIILAAFYLTVRTMLRQKKLGDIKNDFINNMTHEFKTPIATISLAVDAIRNEKVINDRQKLTYFSGIIKEENQRMNRQVETILKASQLEKQEIELNLSPVNVHEVIKEVVDNFVLQLEDKNGKVELVLNADNDLIEADEVHFSNLVNNMVDNAIKYSKENIPPHIKLTTSSGVKNFTLKIEDNGIGMNRETVKRIFERFYRAHTGNVHNVKGFGLGLSYVKTVVQAHNGEIKADSTLGKGSTFIIELPLKKN